VTILQEGSPNRTKLQQNPTTRKEWGEVDGDGVDDSAGGRS
jgi:hypothetical protein